MTSRIILCHAPDDRPAIQTLAHQLRKDGFAPWFHEHAEPEEPGWQETVEQVLHETHALLLCLSPHAIDQTRYINQRIPVVLDMTNELSSAPISVISVQLCPCIIPHSLSHLPTINLFAAQGYEHLRHALSWCPYRRPALATPAHAVHIDQATLHQFVSLARQDGTDAAQTLIDTFVNEMAERLTAMQHAVEQQKSKDLHIAAHSLKSLAGQIGGTLLATMCAELECKAKTGRLEGTDKLLTRATGEYEQVCQELRNIPATWE
jgi:HPt (histidine-containing phosphotransfer) domain-containing protein